MFLEGEKFQTTFVKIVLIWIFKAAMKKQ